MVPAIGADTGEVIMDGITIIITTILAMDGVEVTGEVADMDGTAQADATRASMQEDMPTAIVHHAQAEITM